jgi:uncharacterized membrane protein
MTSTATAPEAVLFSVVLHLDRSLGPAGVRLVPGLFGGLALLGGVAFVLAGAWPVMGFLGLEVALIILGFHWIARAQARAWRFGPTNARGTPTRA